MVNATVNATTAVTPLVDGEAVQHLGVTLDRQRAAFQAEAVVSLATRMDRLDRCLHLLIDNQQALIDAANSDFGNHRSRHITLQTDLYTSVAALKFVKKHLKRWMKPEKRHPNPPLGLFGARAYVHYQPKGVVGLMTPWNVPIGMVFSPLADILGAGNRCMIKPSEYTPACSELIANLCQRYFDDTEIAVVNGGPKIGAAFSALPFDHLLFTGATEVGRHILHAAADNLTPTTLELGGKSPVIIGHDADMGDCMVKVLAAKTLNAGQLCVAADYCFVPESRLEELIAEAGSVFNKLFPSVLDNPDYGAMINARHHQRILSYIDDARDRGARVIDLCAQPENFRDHASNKIPLHLIINPDNDMRTMQNEIFGPVLNIKTYRDFGEPIAFINKQPRALALYYFGQDPEETETVLNQTISGGVTLNDVGMHVGCEDIPFGGVGASGMGSYHGIDGFRTFSHAKAVFKQGRVNIAKLAGTLPPYTSAVDKLMAKQIKK
jgi:coniferyl-aldehyde dehydrogenase